MSAKIDLKQPTTSASKDKDVYHADVLERYAEITRYLISEENARINERTTWLLQLNGLLFAALAFAWSPKEEFIMLLLGLVGLLSSTAIFNSLRWAVHAMDQIENEWSERGKNYSGPPVTGLLKKQGWPFERVILMHPPYALPITLAFAWLAVLVFIWVN